jgi:HK97 family phage major capsid protein
MSTLTEIMEKVNDISTKLNNRVEMLDKEQKRIGDLLTSQTGQMPAEFKDGMSRMNNDLDVLMREFNNLQLNLSKPGAKHFAMGYDSPTVKHEVKTAFIEAIKAVAKGDVYLNGLDPKFQKHTVLQHLVQERKAMYQADATTGGFYAMPEFIDDLIKDIVLLSPYRQLATVYQTSNAWIEIPKRTGVSSAYWAVEQATFTKSTDPRLGMVKIYPHEMRGLLQVSLQSLEDSVFDLAGFVQSELAEQFAFLEGNTFVTGDGNEKPEGVMTNTLVPYFPAGSTTAFTGDALLKMMHALKSVYRANSTWMLTTGSLGYTYSANKFPIAIGDFKRAYVIADRVQMSMTRLSELYAESGLVGFIARKRVGGQVVLPQAIIKMKMSVS